MKRGRKTMLSLSDLTQDEIKYICGKMSLSMVRKYFQGQPKEFVKIKPGFRATKLSDADTLSILVKNYKQPFIHSFIEKVVADCLTQISVHITKLEDEGYSHGEALLKTLPESFFCDNIELYFKAVGEDYSENYLTLFKDALTLIEKERIEKKDVGVNENLDEEFLVYEELYEEANNRLQQLNSELSASQEENNELVKTIKRLKEDVEKGYADLGVINAKLEEVQANASALETELDHYRYLDRYSDEDFEQSDYIQFQHISIGQISHDYSGQIWINRLADVIDGKIIPFYVDDTKPRYFSNRERLYWKNGPDIDDAIGIWNWKAEIRDTDSKKDFITCEYNSNIRMTEIVELPQCKTMDELSGILIKGVDIKINCNKILFEFSNSNGIKEGLLCNANDFENHETKLKLVSSVFMLPSFIVKQSDIIKIADIKVYRRINLGAPNAIVRIRTPYDVVKSMILARVTIPALRDYDLSKKEAQHCKRFIESLPTKTLIQELSDGYACSEEEAEEYIHKFIEYADTYLSADDFDMRIVSNALSRNSELIELCKSQLSEEWETENQDRIGLAQKELDELNTKFQRVQEEIQKAIQSKKELIDELEVVKRQISEKEKFASDVEEKIDSRIMKAKENAAEFISQMAFISPVAGTTTSKNECINPISIINSCMKADDSGEIDDIDTFEEELTENLMAIGYNEETAVEMSQTISFCICTHTILVLGENSVSISQCIAATIGRKELSEIFVSDSAVSYEYLYNVMTKYNNGCNSVFLLHGVLDGYSVNIFNTISRLSLSCNRDAIIILSLEGILSYMVPSGIWNHAMFIDGDKGFTGICSNKLKSFDILDIFKRKYDKVEFKGIRKQLDVYSKILSNMQIYRYAEYLIYFNLDLNHSNYILSQIIIVGKSLGKEDELKSLFRQNGVLNGEKLLNEAK